MADSKASVLLVTPILFGSFAITEALLSIYSVLSFTMDQSWSEFEFKSDDFSTILFLDKGNLFADDSIKRFMRDILPGLAGIPVIYVGSKESHAVSFFEKNPINPFLFVPEGFSVESLLRVVEEGIFYTQKRRQLHSLTEKLDSYVVAKHSGMENNYPDNSPDVYQRIYQKVISEEQTRRSALYESEIEKARKILNGLLPSHIPSSPSFNISTLYLPMERVGGDLYGFIEFENGDFGAFVADVSGHGIASALVASMVKLQFDQIAPMISSPGETLEYLHESLYLKTGGNFVSIFYAIFRKNGCIDYANGGHIRPYFFQKKSGDAIELEVTGRVVGSFLNSKYTDRSVPFESGDRIVLFTDGIIERRKEPIFNGEIIKRAILGSPSVSSYEMITVILREVEKITGEPQFEDDVTLMVIDKK